MCVCVCVSVGAAMWMYKVIMSLAEGGMNILFCESSEKKSSAEWTH